MIDITTKAVKHGFVPISRSKTKEAAREEKRRNTRAVAGAISDIVDSEGAFFPTDISHGYRPEDRFTPDEYLIFLRYFSLGDEFGLKIANLGEVLSKEFDVPLEDLSVMGSTKNAVVFYKEERNLIEHLRINFEGPSRKVTYTFIRKTQN